MYNTRIFLVNHNKLVGRLDQDYSGNVIGCIDNHDDESYVPQDTGEEPRIVGKAATTTSLIVNNAQGSSTSSGSSWDPQLARLGLGTILVGTDDMQNSSKTTQEDQAAAEYLQSSITSSSGGNTFNHAQFYNAITGQESSTSRGMQKPTTTNTTIPATTQPREVNMTADAGGERLPGLLAENFKTNPSSTNTGTIAISTINQSIKDLIILSERDIAYKSAGMSATGADTTNMQSVDTAMNGTPTNTSTTGTDTSATSGTRSGANDPTADGIGNTTNNPSLRGSPFTSSIRDFATSHNTDIYGLLTSSTLGRELFLWILSPAYGGAMELFLGAFSEKLGLGIWEGQDDEIVKEAGMYDGLMRVYWVGAGEEVDGEAVAGMVGEAARG